MLQGDIWLLPNLTAKTIRYVLCKYIETVIDDSSTHNHAWTKLMPKSNVFPWLPNKCICTHTHTSTHMNIPTRKIDWTDCCNCDCSNIKISNCAKSCFTDWCYYFNKFDTCNTCITLELSSQPTYICHST